VFSSKAKPNRSFYPTCYGPRPRHAGERKRQRAQKKDMAKTAAVILTSLIGIACTVLGAASGNSARAQSQLEMNQSAGHELQAAEADMKAILARLFKTAEGRPRSIAKLKQAQSAWEEFRDAHIKAIWPSEEQGAYGSLHPVCTAKEATRLTKARIAELQEMTKRVEGDACGCLWPY
jgi:uncharacterized protein YecT (DUF1311 family)